ncbi:MAG: electron transporter [Alteromonas sp. Nap_26]|jgi:protein SCO1/2|nr:MAG: electron transporter [Alteromonas sp. Nap_26]
MKNLFYSVTKPALLLSIAAFTFASQAQESAADKAPLPFYKSAEFTPYWLVPNSDEAHNFHRVSDFSFTNQAGETVTNATFEDKVYVANFFFTTCPGICPKMRSSIFKVQDHFEDNEQVGIISYSIQPETDTVEVLKKYAEEHNIIDGKWHLVTGDRDDIYQLAREDYFANEDMGEYMENEDFLHTENLLLIDKNRHIRGVYNGLNKTSIQHLWNDINVLLKE